MKDHTYFTRCGDCGTMYRPEVAISLTRGDIGPCWFKPKAIRKPTSCAHPSELIEMWIDGGWRTLPFTVDRVD